MAKPAALVGGGSVDIEAEQNNRHNQLGWREGEEITGKTGRTSKTGSVAGRGRRVDRTGSVGGEEAV